MKTWEQVETFIRNRELPYQVERYNMSLRGTLITLDGQAVAYTVQGVRDHFASPGHPDSKRQASRRRRDLARNGGRLAKQLQRSDAAQHGGSYSSGTRKKIEVRKMQERLQVEQKDFAAKVALRLLGWTTPKHRWADAER